MIAIIVAMVLGTLACVGSAAYMATLAIDHIMED